MKNFMEVMEEEILANRKTVDDDLKPLKPKSATDGYNTPTALPEKTAAPGKTYDNSNTYALNLILPQKTDPNDPNAPLTEEEKNKRTLYIMGVVLAVIFIILIALSMRGKK